MRDLRPDLSNLWRTTARVTSPGGSRAIMFMSARAGEGTTSMAASFALMAAKHARTMAWLVDLDVRRNGAFEGFNQGFARGVGQPGRAYDGSLGQDPFYTISPDTVAVGGAQKPRKKLLCVHQIEGQRLMVTRFRNELLRPGQRVQLKTQAKWWQYLRKAADWIIVDAPSLDRSGAGLVMAGQMDGIVLVVEADKTSAEDVIALRREVEAHGGQVLGVVMNGMRADARLADRLG